jgi:hypothetical protein
MVGMRKLSYEYKIPGRSIAEVYDRFNQALLHHQKPGRVKFCGRKLSAEALTNAAALFFLDLSMDQQEEVLSRYVPQFEMMLSETDEERAEAEARLRLAGEPGGAAREGGVGRTFAIRELSEIERAKKRSGLEPDPQISQVAEGEGSGPGTGDR